MAGNLTILKFNNKVSRQSTTNPCDSIVYNVVKRSYTEYGCYLSLMLPLFTPARTASDLCSSSLHSCCPNADNCKQEVLYSQPGLFQMISCMQDMLLIYSLKKIQSVLYLSTVCQIPT